MTGHYSWVLICSTLGKGFSEEDHPFVPLRSVTVVPLNLLLHKPVGTLPPGPGRTLHPPFPLQSRPKVLLVCNSVGTFSPLLVPSHVPLPFPLGPFLLPYSSPCLPSRVVHTRVSGLVTEVGNHRFSCPFRLPFPYAHGTKLPSRRP